MKKFITQQETTVPQNRRKTERVYSKNVPKKRGRKQSLVDARRLLILRRFAMANNRGLSREEFAAAIGIDPRTMNSLSSAFLPVSDSEKRAIRKRQHAFDSACDPTDFVAIPVCDEELLAEGKITPPKTSEKCEVVIVPRDKCFGNMMDCFAFVMPDNCMLSDGICEGDRIVAVKNIRPAHGDMVACRIPGTSGITVRRIAGTCNPFLFDLYEGGTSNPLSFIDLEDLIRGVVIFVQREYLPGRMPIKPDTNTK